MKIPYGMSNFAEMRRSGYYYADKTHFIPQLESEELGNRYLVFLRPRRFGKSLFISTLEHYYELAQAPHFDALFGGLAIHREPTPLKNRFLVLTLDFSPVTTDRGSDFLYTSFTRAIREQIRRTVQRHAAMPPLRALRDRLDSIEGAPGLLQSLFAAVEDAGHQLYILIDEYDSFANDLIARGDFKTYDEAVSATGFVKAFFKAIKEGTRDGVVARLFVTGVSPIMLDDMASGFNISSQITHSPRFETLAGLTRPEVELAVDQFLARTPGLGTREGLLEELERYYNGYRFNARSQDRVFNPDMVLYYLRELRDLGSPPSQILDVNIRVDYTKLQRMASPPGGTQDWHLEYLEALLSGEPVTGTLIERFGVRQIYDQQHFLSLLYCMGLITHAEPVMGKPSFRIPNLVIRTLHWDGLAQTMRMQAGAAVDTLVLQDAVSRMAYLGELKPLLDLLEEKVLQVLSRRDFRLFDEKGIKLILLTYLSLSPIYQPLSETELRQGYSDVFLTLDRRYPDAKYAWMLELKYCKAEAGEAEIETKRQEALAQIDRYLADPVVLPRLKGDRILRAAVIVVQGPRVIHLEVVRELD